MSDTMMITLAVAAMAGVSIGGIGYAVLSPSLTNRERSARRIKAVVQGGQSGSLHTDNSAKAKERRKAVQDKLKQLEKNQKKTKKRISLRARIERAGLSLTPSVFYALSALSGLFFALFTWSLGQSYLVVLGAAFAGMLGFPIWLLNYLASRRQKAFSEEFANAIDVIVRGIKSGLPLNECLQIIATEAHEPVRSEFLDLVESQRMGVPLEQGLQRMLERMPLPEVNFFTIVLSIQAKSGGNLSEALGNLSSVLRARKMMRAKIQAMSSEAKASAGIIGSLPPGVMILIYFSTPNYIMTLFTTAAGNAMLVGSAIWMLIGVLVMKKMISFKF